MFYMYGKSQFVMSGAVLFRTNQNNDLAGCYDGTCLKIYAIENHNFSEIGVLDVACTDFAFLPRRVGNAILVISDTCATLHRPTDEPGVFTCSEVRGVGKLGSCLKVSLFEKGVLFGCLSDGNVHVYELLLDRLYPTAKIVRRYGRDTSLVWFDFTSQANLVATSEDHLLLYTLSRNAPMGNILLPEFCRSVVTGAASPANSGCIALLTREGTVCIYDNCFRQIPLTFPDSRALAWSPFGYSLVVVNADNTYKVVRQTRPGVWELAE